VLTVLDARTGKPILEGERLPKLGTLYASPLAAAGRIYLIDPRRHRRRVEVGRQAEVLATNKLDDVFDASPAVVGKTLYLRGERHLYAIEEKAER
jgi:hypothetical protein